MDSLLVAHFCSLLLHFRFLQLDFLDSALNAWNLVDLVKSLQRDSKYLHINDSVVGCWNAVESVWMSVLSSIIKSWKYYAHLKYESVLLRWMQNLPSMFNRYGILYKLYRAALCGVESLPSKTENDKIQDLSIGPIYNISLTWIPWITGISLKKTHHLGWKNSCEFAMNFDQINRSPHLLISASRSKRLSSWTTTGSVRSRPCFFASLKRGKMPFFLKQNMHNCITHVAVEHRETFAKSITGQRLEFQNWCKS